MLEGGNACLMAALATHLFFFFRRRQEGRPDRSTEAERPGFAQQTAHRARRPRNQNRKETIPPGSGNGQTKTQGIIIELFVVEEFDAVLWRQILQICSWVTVTEGHCAR